MGEKAKVGKIRHCWNCGADMGFIENRFYDRMDTCGAAACERESRDVYREERDEAHRAVDDYFDGGW